MIDVYTLAAYLGQPVLWVMRNVTGLEWAGWLQFMTLYPFGPRQDDFRAAVIASSLGGGERIADLFPSIKPKPDRGGRSFRQWATSQAPGYVRPTPGEGSH